MEIYVAIFIVKTYTTSIIMTTQTFFAVARHYIFPLWDIEVDVSFVDKRVMSMKVSGSGPDFGYYIAEFDERGNLDLTLDYIRGAKLIQTLIKFIGTRPDKIDIIEPKTENNGLFVQKMVTLLTSITFSIPVLIDNEKFTTLRQVVHYIVNKYGSVITKEHPYKLMDFNSDNLVLTEDTTSPVPRLGYVIHVSYKQN